MKSSTARLLQVTDYYPEEGKLEIRTTTSDPMPSNYLLVSKKDFYLPKIV